MISNFLRLSSEASLGGSFWMPPQATALAANTDALFYFILVLCVIFFIIVVGAMFYFAIKYRRRSPNQRTSDIKGSHTVELVWSVIPAILLIIIFAWGFKDWLALSIPPANALDVRVTGRKWSWAFNYPKDNITANELIVPVDQPVRLTMSSTDVLHSFFVPAFRIKRDVLPNRYTVVWFEANTTGDFEIYCTEYCGTDHSRMLSKVKVLSQTDYDKWIQTGGGLDKANMSSVDLGKLYFTQFGCNSCHSVDGTAKIGPTLAKKYGTEHELEGGAKVLVDDNYLRESIVNPTAKIAKGFAPVMPSFQGQINDEQMNALIDYIKEIGK